MAGEPATQTEAGAVVDHGTVNLSIVALQVQLDIGRGGVPDDVVQCLLDDAVDGFTAAQVLKQRWPDRAVIMLSLRDDDGTQLRGRQAGTSAFVAKHQMEGPLLAAIRKVAGHTLA